MLSKEAAARAARELATLAAARAELLARWQILLMDKTLSRETQIALRKARNALQDHLERADLVGALRDKLGVPVRISGSSEAWDHLKEVDDADKSLTRLYDWLSKELRRAPSGSPNSKMLSQEISALKETQHRIREFLEIR